MRKGDYPVLTPGELAEAGEALYGANWRAELARALGLADDSQICAVEVGRLQAPTDWRARLIVIAQDAALRAMQAAGALLWRESENSHAFQAPRLA